jgi:hypothetical protein
MVMQNSVEDEYSQNLEDEREKLVNQANEDMSPVQVFNKMPTSSGDNYSSI